MPLLPGLAQGNTTCQDRIILKLTGVEGRSVGQICDYIDEMDTFFYGYISAEWHVYLRHHNYFSLTVVLSEGELSAIIDRL